MNRNAIPIDESGGAGPRHRSRGRPARISRERVLAAAVELLETEGDEALTIKRVAESLEATPMAVYRYVPNRAALIEGVAELLIDDMAFDVPTAPCWQTRVERWMDAARTYFTARPGAMSVIGTAETSSPAWMRAVTPLVETLRAAGFSDSATALGVAWTARLTIGVLLQELRGSLTQHHVVSSLGSLREDELRPWLPLAAALGEVGDDRIFDFTKRQVVRALEDLID